MLSNYELAKRKAGAFQLNSYVYVPQGENSKVFKGLTNIREHLVVTRDNTSFTILAENLLTESNFSVENLSIETRSQLERYETSRNSGMCLDITHLLGKVIQKRRVVMLFAALRELPLSGGEITGTDAYILMHPVARGVTPIYMKIENSEIRVGYIKGAGLAIGKEGLNIQLFNKGLSSIGFRLKIETPRDNTFDDLQPWLSYTKEERDSIQADFETFKMNRVGSNQ